MINQAKNYVYKDQIKAFLQTGQGYTGIRQKLFKDLDRLSQQDLITFFYDIFWDLQSYLLKENYNYCARALDIIEDLLNNYQTELSKAINNSDMALSLHVAGTHKKFITLHREEWQVYQKRVRGLFLFWFNKYQYEETNYSKLIKYYRKMREDGFQFPKQENIDINPRLRRQKKKDETVKINERKNVNVALQDILPIIQEAQYKLEHTPEKLIDKQYVRLLKTKNKYLYQLSTGDTSSLTAEDKKKISTYYKRLRNILKEINAINEKIVQMNKIKQQMIYIAGKTQGLSPKKNEVVKKEEPIDLIDIVPTKIQESPKIEKKPIICQDILDINPIANQSTNKQEYSPNKLCQISQQLIDMNNIKTEQQIINSTNTPQKKSNQDLKLSRQLQEFKQNQQKIREYLSTPTKNQNIQDEQQQFDNFLTNSHDKLKDQFTNVLFQQKKKQPMAKTQNLQMNQNKSQSENSSPLQKGQQLQFQQTPKKSKISQYNQESPNNLTDDLI